MNDPQMAMSQMILLQKISDSLRDINNTLKLLIPEEKVLAYRQKYLEKQQEKLRS